MKDSLLEKLTILDFMATDIGLYLNTHPEDEEFIRKYNLVTTEAAKVRAIYEEKYEPLISFRSEAKSGDWNWIDCPWPWESSFNFVLRGE